MSIVGFLSFAAFTLLCLIGAGAVFLHRPDTRPGITYVPMLWAIFLPITVFVLLGIGSWSEYGKRLTVSVSELRIPLAEAKSDGTWFIVGPRPETSDLVVGPYAGADQTEEAYRADFEGLLTIVREQGLLKVCGKAVLPDGAANLPGMQVRFNDEKTPGKDCKLISEAPLKAVIERLDEDKVKPATRRILSISLASPPTEGEAPKAVRITLKDDEQLIRHWGRCNQTGGDVLRLAPAGLHRDDLGYRVPNNLVFNQLGQGGAHPLLAPERLGPLTTDSSHSPCDALSRRFTWPAVDADARLVLTTRTTSIPYWIGWLVLGVCLSLARLCRTEWDHARGRTEAALVLALVWLLTLRLLVALSGLPNDPGLDLTSLIWPPAMALVCVPLISIALVRGHRKDTRRDMAMLAAVLAAGALFIAWSLEWHWPGGQELALAIVTLALLMIRGLNTSAKPLVAVLLELAGAAAGPLARLAAALWNWLRAIRPDLRLPQADTLAAAVRDPFIAGLVLAGATFTVRLVLSLIGRYSGGKPFWQERLNGIPVIENLPLSLVYAPLAIIAIAMMMTGYRARPRPLRAVLLAAAFAALFLAIGIAVADLGIILIFAVPVGWGIAKLAKVPLSGTPLLTSGARAMLVLPLLSPFLMLAGYYAFYGLAPVPNPDKDLAGHMEAVTHWDTNVARLQRFVDAKRLVDVGSSAAFEALDQAAQLEPITSHTFGRGYLEKSGVVAPLLQYQLSDNLLAVQIAWPFGRMGLAALMGGLQLMLVGLRGTSPAPPGAHWLLHASTLAAATVFWSGAYMALANLNLVPFTGRNFYLLSARSFGDLAEGFVLLLMVVLPMLVLSAQPEEEKKRRHPLAARPEVWLALVVSAAIMFVHRAPLPREPEVAMQEGRGYRGAADALARSGCLKLLEGPGPNARARLALDAKAATCPVEALLAPYEDTTLFEAYSKKTALGGDMANLVETRWQFDRWEDSSRVIAIRPNAHQLRFADNPRSTFEGTIEAEVSAPSLERRLWSDGMQVRPKLIDCPDKRIDGKPPAGEAAAGQFVQCHVNGRWQAWQTVTPIRSLSESVDSARRVRHPVLSSVLAQAESDMDDAFETQIASSLNMQLHNELQVMLDNHLALAPEALLAKTEGPPRAGILLIDGMTGVIAAAPSHPHLSANASVTDRREYERRRLNWNFQPLPVGSAAKVPFAAAILLAKPELGEGRPRINKRYPEFCERGEAMCQKLAREKLGVDVRKFITVSSNGYALWLIDQAWRGRSPGWVETMRKLSCIEPLGENGDPTCSRYLWRGDEVGLTTRGRPQPLLQLDVEAERSESLYLRFHNNILGDNRSVWTSANLAQAYARLFADRAMNPRLTPAPDRGGRAERLYLYGERGERLKVWQWLRDGMAGVLQESQGGTAKTLCSAQSVKCQDGHRVGRLWLYAKTGTPTIVTGKEDGKVLVLMAVTTASGSQPNNPGDITGLKVVVITQRYQAAGREAIDLAVKLFGNRQFRTWLGLGLSTPPAAKTPQPQKAGDAKR